MITIEEAKMLINNNTPILNDERLPLTDSLGFVLSEDILSSINLPSFKQSAMDGYAVCFSSQSLTSFKLVKEVKTGDTKLVHLKKGECARIFTGAMIPEGNDAVVMLEKVTVKGKIIHPKKQPSLGDNIRKIGEQIKKNETASASPDLIIVCEDLINEISHSSLLF